MALYGLSKREKLCSETAISMLFGGKEGTRGAIAYPLRAVWREGSVRRDKATDTRFLISVPKKRLRHAVDRVTMRRRCREAYRLNRHDYPGLADRSIDVAFIYIADKLLPYAAVDKAIRRLLQRISPASREEVER